MKTSMQLLGADEVRRALRALPEEVQKRELADASRAGALVIRDDIRPRVPILAEPHVDRRPGAVRDAVRATRGKRTGSYGQAFVYVRTLTARAVAGWKKKNRGKRSAQNPDDPFYWRFLEFGTSKMAARPFFRPGFDSAAPKAAQAIVDALRTGVARAAEKVRGKSLW